VPRLTEVSATTAHRLAAEGHRILDVREDDEWAAGHIAGSVHVPLMQIPTRHGELDPDADYLCVCKVGGRSAQATVYLSRLGLRISNVEGGLDAWARAGLPVEASGGGPGRVL
jgi:rhodanese-related sulfurtransferase